MVGRRALVFVVVGVVSCALATACSSPSVERRPAVMMPPPATGQVRLPNGLLVVLQPDASAAEAAVYVRYRVGDKDAPRGRAGLAHLVEHLMFRGPKRDPRGDFHARLERLGGADANAETSLDTTDYFAIVPPPALYAALWLEAQRMARPLADVDDDMLAAERAVVANEIRERVDGDPTLWPTRLALRAVFGEAHPYASAANPSGDLDAITVDDVRAFVARHYRPDNAAIVVTGAFDPGAMPAVVTQLFARIPPGHDVAPRAFPRPRLSRTETLVVDLPVEQPVIVFAWPVPSPAGDGHLEIELVAPLIEGYLRTVLVGREQLASSVVTHHIEGRLGSVFAVAVLPTPDHGAAEIGGWVAQSLGRLAGLGRTFEWESFSVYREECLVERTTALDALVSRARAAEDGLDAFGAANALAEDVRLINRIRPADIGTAVEQFLVSAPHRVVVARPLHDGAARP